MYATTTNRKLSDCYGTYSFAKAQAYLDCKDFMNDLNGEDLRIVSYSSDFFTVGFWGVVDGKKAFVIITHANIYYVFYDEI